MEAMKDYVAHLDNKKRITLRGAAYQYYNVKEYGNGCIILEPQCQSAFQPELWQIWIVQ